MIYTISIPNYENLSEEKIDKVQSAVTSICQWNFRPWLEGSDILELVSERVTVGAMQAIAEKLIAIGVQYTVQDLEALYTHVATTAPDSYDGFGTTELFTSKTAEGKTERHLAVMKVHFEWQVTRYASGLYAYRVIA